MPSLTGQFDASIGVIINVIVLPPGFIQPGTKITTNVSAFPALVDTGASTTCISPHVVQAVGLRSIGLEPVVSATHTVPVPVYLVDLLLPIGTAGMLHQGIQVLEYQTHGASAHQMLWDAISSVRACSP